MANAAPASSAKQPEKNVHLENFEVVLIKSSAGGPHAAAPEDFRRIPVEAESTLSAQYHDDVEAAIKENPGPDGAPGWLRLFVMPPGVLSEPELLARQRQHTSAYSFDSTKAKFVG